jgi:hypothetical protein
MNTVCIDVGELSNHKEALVHTVGRYRYIVCNIYFFRLQRIGSLEPGSGVCCWEISLRILPGSLKVVLPLLKLFLECALCIILLLQRVLVSKGFTVAVFSTTVQPLSNKLMLGKLV